MRRLTFVLALLAFACGGDSTGPNTSIAGTYSLRTVNGANLPFIIAQTGQDKVELVSESYSLTDSGTFTQLTEFRSTINGQVTTATDVDAGIYVRNGTAITITYQSGPPGSNGNISGDTMTLVGGGLSLVYRK